MTNIKSAVPKYKKIGNQLINDILQLKFEIGETLPTEKELCLRFKVSRHTIREALRYIENTGLIEKRQGSGSTVVATTLPDTINQVVSNVNDILQHGNDTIFHIHHSELINLDDTIAPLLETEVGEKCMHIAGLRVEPHDKKPVCYTDIYRLPHQDLIYDSFQDISKALNTKSIGKIEQKISACILPNHLAGVLNADKNSAALKITRRYFTRDKSNIILIAESIYAENRFSYSTVLYPE